MSSFNNVTLLGNLTFKPSLSYTPQGTAVTRMRLAVNEVITKKDKTQAKDTLFIDIQVWMKQAETCAEYLDKGSMVLVSGRLRFNQWEGKEKQKHSKHYVIANRVIFLSRSEKQVVDEIGEDRAAPGKASPDSIPPEEDQPSMAGAESDDDIPF